MTPKPISPTVGVPSSRGASFARVLALAVASALAAAVYNPPLGFAGPSRVRPR